MPATDRTAGAFDIPIDEDWLDAQAALLYGQAEAVASSSHTDGRRPSPLRCNLIPATPTSTSSPVFARPDVPPNVQWIHRQPKAHGSPSSWRHTPPRPVEPSNPATIPPHRRLPSTSSTSSDASSALSSLGLPRTPPDWNSSPLSSSLPNMNKSILTRSMSKRSQASTAKSVKFVESPTMYSPICEWPTDAEDTEVPRERFDPRSVRPPGTPAPTRRWKKPLKRLLSSNSGGKSPVQPPVISGPFALGSFAPPRHYAEFNSSRRSVASRSSQTRCHSYSHPLQRVPSVDSMKSGRSIGGRSVKSESGKSMLSINSVSSSFRNWFDKAVGKRAG